MSLPNIKPERIFKGIFPLYKKAGLHPGEPLKWLIYQLKNEISKQYKLRVKTFGPLYKEASGIMTIGIERSIPYLKYLKLCPVEYEVKARLGTKTSSSFADGQIVDTMSYDHVTMKLLADVLASFVGTIVLKSSDTVPSTGYAPYAPYLSDHPDKKSDEKFLPFSLRFRPNTEIREVQIDDISLIDFNLPEITFTVHGTGMIYVRSLWENICQKMDTCGCLVSLTKSIEGPFTINDCVYPRDFDPDYLRSHLQHFTPIYLDHISPHIDKIPLGEHRGVR